MVGAYTLKFRRMRMAVDWSNITKIASRLESIQVNRDDSSINFHLEFAYVYDDETKKIVHYEDHSFSPGQLPTVGQIESRMTTVREHMRDEVIYRVQYTDLVGEIQETQIS